MNETSNVWQGWLEGLLYHPEHKPSPRGKETLEALAGQYVVPMPAYIDLAERKMNIPFLFGEAWWIVSGSNRLDDLLPYMKSYKNFSDEGIFLKGAYGPKIVDQLAYVVDCLEADEFSRQAVLNIWRERPAPSKDIPCTISMQFFLRGGELHSLVTMRSQDIVNGYTYDVFTFSMVAFAVMLLLRARGVLVYNLGSLTVTAGSLHLYRETMKGEPVGYEQALSWASSRDVNFDIERSVDIVMNARAYGDLIHRLKVAADTWLHSTT